ncbi:MAG TPA: phosphatase PAP2 family protein [Gaiellaceae bacterium]
MSAGAFVALGALVAGGALTGFDQWACDHLMPFAGPATGGPPSFLESVVPLYHASWATAGLAVTQIVTLPGQVLISFAIVAVAAWKLRAPVWIVVWFGAVVVEVVLRHTLTRPALYRDGLHVTAFDSSWPSGHALRCALVAAVVAAMWPRARTALLAWLVAAAVLLELAGFHTPTDVVGGLLLALLACGAAWAVGASCAAGAARALRKP